MGRRRLLPLLLAVLAAVAADELEKPAGEEQQVELATTPAPTPVPVCKGGCPPNCNYPRLCKIHQTTYKCRCASCEKQCINQIVATRPRLNHDVHTIDATSARWRGRGGLSPLDSVSTVASSPRMDLVKNYRVHPTHWLIYAQAKASCSPTPPPCWNNHQSPRATTSRPSSRAASWRIRA